MDTRSNNGNKRICRSTSRTICNCNFSGWSLLNRHVTDLGILPQQWRWSVLKNILGYTTALNAAGLAALLFEPLAKFSLNYTAGPALVALFELANRLAAQVRGVAVSAAMPLVPAFASFADTEDAALKATLNRSNGMLSLIAAAMTVVVALAAPILSHLVLGRIDIVLLKMTAVLGTAWSINCSPFHSICWPRAAGYCVGILQVTCGLDFACCWALFQQPHPMEFLRWFGASHLVSSPELQSLSLVTPKHWAEQTQVLVCSSRPCLCGRFSIRRHYVTAGCRPAGLEMHLI